MTNPLSADLSSRVARGVRAAQAGLLVNTVLALIKLVAGLVGHSYALVADAIESMSDVVSSLIVWGGLRLSARQADDDYPFGYGKAEGLAAAVVGLLLIGAAVGIAAQSVREIVTPHHVPAPFTLVVLFVVVVVKEIFARRVAKVGREVASAAVTADAWHHHSDALTSAVAAVGIGIALWGSRHGHNWAAADDWAALVAAAVILWNGTKILRAATADLMDRSPGRELPARVAAEAMRVLGVCEVEKLLVRRAGLGVFVEIHVEADPQLSLRDAHVLSGIVKSTLRREIPQIQGLVVHMEPHEPPVVDR